MAVYPWLPPAPVLATCFLLGLSISHLPLFPALPFYETAQGLPPAGYIHPGVNELSPKGRLAP